MALHTTLHYQPRSLLGGVLHVGLSRLLKVPLLCGRHVCHRAEVQGIAIHKGPDRCGGAAIIAATCGRQGKDLQDARGMSLPGPCHHKRQLRQAEEMLEERQNAQPAQPR